MGCCDTYLNVVGIVTLLYLGSKVVKLFLRLWRESLWSSTFDFKKFGKWAVITGGSDGIGKSTVIELAKCNMNIVIIARTLSKLEKVAKEITEKYNIEVIIIPVDVTGDDNIFEIIKEKIEGLDIALLINNVAVAQVDPTKLLDVPDHEKYSTNCIKANINTMLRLTEMVLPGMVKRGGGLVVNVSSLLGSVDSPFYAMYGGSKKMIISYTEAMAQEYQSKGVIFQCFSPGATETPMTSGSMNGSNAFTPKGENYGKYVIKALGKSSYTNTCCLVHNAFQQILYLMPTSIFSALMGKAAEQAVKK